MSDLSRLRVGDTVRIDARAIDSLGQPCGVENPFIGTIQGDVDVLEAEDSPVDPLSVSFEAVGSGEETILVAGRDSWDSSISLEIPCTVLDASALRLEVTSLAHCGLIRSRNGQAVIKVLASPESDPTFVLTITPVDDRDVDNDSPSYAIADGPNSVSTFGRIILNGHGAGDPCPDLASVPCALSGRGPETITATATTAGGAMISGSIDVLILSADSFDYTATVVASVGEEA